MKINRQYRRLLSVLPLALTIFLAAPISVSAAAAAVLTSSKVMVNGKSIAFEAYNIQGSNYFKLREIACTISGTASQFSVGWDAQANAISLTRGQAYTLAGSEMSGKSTSNKSAQRTMSEVYLDGKKIYLTAYNIDGSNYFKLRDLGAALNFAVDWDGDAQIVSIVTPDSVDARFAMEQTFYNEVRANDGVLLWMDSYWYPVFKGNSSAANKMNAVYASEDQTANVDANDLLQSYYSKQGYTYEEANDGRVGGMQVTTSVTYNKDDIVSFLHDNEWDGLGPHGEVDFSGHTFNIATGDELKLTDVLKVNAANVSDILSKEFLSEYTIDDDMDSSLREASTLDIPFWLENDGVHIFYGPYTFYYAFGSREIVIPYSRADLIKEMFYKP